MHTVKRAFYIKEYKILLEFDDNVFRMVDLKDEIWGPVFEPLKDLNYFKKVKAKGGTIVWPNEADFCPDVLYEISTPPSFPKQTRPSTSKHAASKKPRTRRTSREKV